MALSAEQLDAIEVHVGGVGWSAYTALPAEQRLNLEKALRVHGREDLVAAAVLDDLAANAQRVKALEVGPIKIDFQASAPFWLSRAAQLRDRASRAEVVSPGSANPAPVIEPWGVG
ncbi:hypothetical protein [Deinococcus peraridilitoris]|uniref:Uncharacterized protein n=1 Tax=Deinococcus peraridilitoris (strain DSM 19664 / LMG 22246 / CIP 109416 / KR-200) TaxID=937777 RepID=K9ZZP5_DEIPD|nr:hypothetical protein [Deinococcus peraridilitoris]AFZ67076.1 hypothetical protein Deipe_1535 [Deinococcus peraridilitoris DSM 19664]